MANPTTNYGFVLPTSSDLVTDLPADFDVALQGVDTRLKALQPGTTLGDLAYSSATANTNTRLGIGSNGQVLAVSSGVPAWQTLSADSYTSLATGTLSGTSVTLSSISQSYRNLELWVNLPTTAADANLSFRINSTTSGYDTVRTLTTSTSLSSSTGNSGFITPFATHTDAQTVRFIVPMYALTGYKPFQYQASGGPYSFSYFGNINSFTAAVTQIIIRTDAGTQSFTGGTYTLYGVK
jgi:hypothetical protein